MSAAAPRRWLWPLVVCLVTAAYTAVPFVLEPRFFQRGDTAALTAADVAFHALLVSLADSPRLSRMHDTLMVETRMCLMALETRYASHSFRLEEHREIVRAVRDADADLADRLLTEHMRDAVQRLTTDAT